MALCLPLRREERLNSSWFVIGNEYQFGEPPHDGIMPPDTRVLSHIQQSKELGLCNGFRVFTDFWGLKSKELDELIEGGNYFVIIDLFRCLPGTIDMIMRKMEKHGESVWGCALGERDDCCRWEDHAGNFRTKKEAAQWFKKWVLDEAWVWKRPRRNRPMKTVYLKDLKSRFLPHGNIADYLRNRSQKHERVGNLSAHAGSLFALHHYYEWGFDMVWLERNCYLTNVQLGVAFLRGAANQYNRYWGLDFSPWGALFKAKLVHYDKNGVHRGGFSESLLIREWMVAFAAGANFLFQEYSSCTHWLDPDAVTSNPQLSPAGELARKFADFALRRHSDRGRPYVPAALMLEHDHGWDPPRWEEPYFVWGNKIPYGPAERMIEYFFDWAFPDYKMSSIGYEVGCNPDVPWQTAEEYDAMFKAGCDIRPFDKGILSASRWGDSFDVVLDNCRLDVLKGYPALFLLGRVTLAGRHLKKFRRYVEDGGILLLNSNQIFGHEELYFSDDWDASLTEFLGVNPISFSDELFGPVQCRLCKKKLTERRFVYSHYEPITAEVICQAYNGTALAFSNKIGKGKVILMAPHYLLGLRKEGLLNIGQHLLDHVMEPLSIVRVRGPDMQYLVNQKNDGLFVTLINNGPAAWSGEVRIKASGNPWAVKEIWREKDVRFKIEKNEILFRDKLKPFDFKVYEVSG